MSAKGITTLMLALTVLAGGEPAARGAEAPGLQQDSIDQTPARLSFIDGQASFWRPGAQDWAQAQVNVPLAPGDQLYTGSPGNLELQIDSRAFVRAWANTQVGLENQEPNFFQFKVTTGHASFDLRTLEPGHMVEVDTPNAAFTIEHPGYYRLDISDDRTSFITRRGGRATLIPPSGTAVAIAPSEEVVIEGTANPQVSSYVAPPRDDWDTWNYARADQLLDAVSARYVSPGTYGLSDLDRYGTWRVVPTYGSVWVPTAVSPGWVPYSTGTWMQDPFYGWTWVDSAPWGWAPFHYGRWVFVDGFWAWAPGPVLARPVYAPALVAFFRTPAAGVSVSVGGPVVGWVALGWGEPCVPWWGPAGFVQRPWWGGWGGPRVVNNVVIEKTTVVNVQSITVYRNTSVQNAVIAIGENRFGHGPIATARLTHLDARSLQPLHTGPQVTPTAASFVPTVNRGIRPPATSLSRSVVATRPPHPWSGPAAEKGRPAQPTAFPAPAPHLVSVPRQPEPAQALPRPRFGQSTVERATAERARPPAPPRLEGPRRPERAPEGTPPAARQASPPPGRAPQVAAPPSAAPQPPAHRAEARLGPGRPLPGEPANRLSPHRAEASPPERVERRATQPPAPPHNEPKDAHRERPGG